MEKDVELVCVKDRTIFCSFWSNQMHAAPHTCRLCAWKIREQGHAGALMHSALVHFQRMSCKLVARVSVSGRHASSYSETLVRARVWNNNICIGVLLSLRKYEYESCIPSGCQPLKGVSLRAGWQLAVWILRPERIFARLLLCQTL